MFQNYRTVFYWKKQPWPQTPILAHFRHDKDFSLDFFSMILEAILRPWNWLLSQYPEHSCYQVAAGQRPIFANFCPDAGWKAYQLGTMDWNMLIFCTVYDSQKTLKSI